MELVVVIPTDFQRVCYLDKGDLYDDTTIHCNDIVPGTTVTLMIWPYDGWAELRSCLISKSHEKGNMRHRITRKSKPFVCEYHVSIHDHAAGSHSFFEYLKSVMSKPAPPRSSHPSAMGSMGGAPSWLSHRLFSALFISAHRGHMPAVRSLLQQGTHHRRGKTSGYHRRTGKTLYLTLGDFDQLFYIN
ncbi:unnamed protein product [Coregonus sp. 'balchen']|nr:unnamed protein product [Coregonus sp. 'balchen']